MKSKRVGNGSVAMYLCQAQSSVRKIPGPSRAIMKAARSDLTPESASYGPVHWKDSPNAGLTVELVDKPDKAASQLAFLGFDR
jgi:hypothetical protein